jgi:hypothetical protein
MDKGISWAAVNSGLTNLSVSAIVLVGNNLFAGTNDGGVFLSTDQGTGWAAVNTGLEHSDERGLAVLNVNLVAGTWKKGIWQRPLSEMIEIVDNHPLHIPAEYLISQNYPNPFNPGTRIDYSIPRQSHVTLKIFDILGREVATLADESQEAGDKSIAFDGATLPSGVYFYRIVAGNFTETKKMILAK